MKNNMKKRVFAALTAGFLAITPTIATGLTAFAGTGDSSITITDGDTVTHDYYAYQIFAGTSETKEGGVTQLNGLSWGSDVDTTDGTGVKPQAIINAINTALGLTGNNKIADGAGVDDVAKKLKGLTDENAQKVAKELRALYAGKKVAASKVGRVGTSDNYMLDGIDDGWYLILDETESLTNPDTVRSANMLVVVGSGEMTTKHSLPEITKKIVQGSSRVDENTAAIGENIQYEITIKVPDVRGYDNYIYNVVDTLSAGLTYNNDLTITPATYVKNTDWSVTEGPATPATAGTEIRVVFLNAIETFKGKNPGEEIKITYSARLNENAVIGDAGNPNKAKLVYSNDPAVAQQGTPGTDNTPDPDPENDPRVGVTPNKEVKTYTGAIEIDKVDQSKKLLKGAKFKLTSESIVELIVESGDVFKADPAGEYYQLVGGTYTKTAPTEGTKSKYVAKAGADVDGDFDISNYETYKKDGYTTTTQTSIETEQTIEAYVDDYGKLVFKGLKPGTYTLTELVAPANYNLLEEPLTITLTVTDSNKPSEWDVSGATWDEDKNAFVIEVENRLGAQLPSTGGIGTRMFYLIGGLLAAGSAIFLITRKRMSFKEN